MTNYQKASGLKDTGFMVSLLWRSERPVGYSQGAVRALFLLDTLGQTPILFSALVTACIPYTTVRQHLLVLYHRFQGLGFRGLRASTLHTSGAFCRLYSCAHFCDLLSALVLHFQGSSLNIALFIWSFP